METTRGDITYYRFSQILFLMGVFAKQFYVLPSGSFQIGDALFILSFLVSVFCRDRGGIRVQESEKPIIWFVVCVTIINIIYITFSFTKRIETRPIIHAKNSTMKRIRNYICRISNKR